MNTYTIDVSRIEELQMIKDTDELDRMFEKAKSTIVNGESVLLVRTPSNGPAEQFDELTTLPDLDQYRAQVYKDL